MAIFADNIADLPDNLNISEKERRDSAQMWIDSTGLVLQVKIKASHTTTNGRGVNGKVLLHLRNLRRNIYGIYQWTFINVWSGHKWRLSKRRNSKMCSYY